MTIDTVIRCTICNRTPAALRLNDHNLCAPCAHALIDQAAPPKRAPRSPEEIHADRVRRAEAAIVQVLTVRGEGTSRSDLRCLVPGPAHLVHDTIRAMIADGRIVECRVPATHPRTGHPCVRDVLMLAGASTSTHKGAGGEGPGFAGVAVHASA